MLGKVLANLLAKVLDTLIVSDLVAKTIFLRLIHGKIVALVCSKIHNIPLFYLQILPK